MKTPPIYKETDCAKLIYHLAKMLKPEVYVEIGVKKGYTFNLIAPCISFIKRAIAVDINDCRKYLRNDPSVEFYQMSSAEFVDKLENENPDHKTFEPFIDFLFIDANHRYEFVMLDFERLHHFVKPYTGLIFLHDTFPVKEELLEDGYCSNAWKAASEIHKKYEHCEIVTIPGPWAGVSIIRRVHNNKHGWMDNG